MSEKDNNPGFIPTTFEEIDQEFHKEMKNNENGKLFYLLFSGMKFNRKEMCDIKFYIRNLLPIFLAIMTVIISAVVTLS